MERVTYGKTFAASNTSLALSHFAPRGRERKPPGALFPWKYGQMVLMYAPRPRMELPPRGARGRAGFAASSCRRAHGNIQSANQGGLRETNDDEGTDPDFTGVELYVHLALIEKGIPLIQFVTNLSQIGTNKFVLIALPLKIKGGDASPARVVALVE